MTVRRDPLGYVGPFEIFMPKFKATVKEAGVDYKQEDGLGASETLNLNLAGNFQFWSFIVLDASPRTMRSAPFWKNPGTSFRYHMYRSPIL